METKNVQLIGHPKDGQLQDVTAFEIRSNESIFVPYVPADATYDDVAYAEYRRFLAGTNRGQIMLWVNPHTPMQALQQVVQSLLSGERSTEGVWLLQGADMHGQLQMLPLSSTTQ
jgi:hypothetical protein